MTIAGGGVFFSNWIDDAFAIVDAGAPGVGVRSENRLVGTTGRDGRLLVDDLRAFQRNSISLDPSNLPIEAVVEQTDEIVVPADRGGVVVDFGIQATPAAAVIVLSTVDGAPVPVGLDAVLMSSGENFVIGFDGQTFATGLVQTNVLQVTQLDGSVCEARFEYQPSPGEIQMIHAPCL